jgi:hypothetical protein
MAASIRPRVSSLMGPLLLTNRETDVIETFARRATSASVGREEAFTMFCLPRNFLSLVPFQFYYLLLSHNFHEKTSIE